MRGQGLKWFPLMYAKSTLTGRYDLELAASAALGTRAGLSRSWRVLTRVPESTLVRVQVPYILVLEYYILPYLALE